MNQQQLYKETLMRLKKLLSSATISGVLAFASIPSTHAGGGGIAARLTSLVSTIQNTQGIVNATVNSITDMQTTYGNGNLLSNQQQNLVNWNKGLNNQIGAALQQLGLNANNFSTTQSALQQIQLASQTAAGRLQAIQAGNQIAGMMVNETQALHGTIIAAEQARLNAIAKQENEKYQDELLYRNFFRNHSGQY